MKRRGKVIALSTLALGLVVLVALRIASKDWIREEWRTRKLEVDDGDGGAVAR